MCEATLKFRDSVWNFIIGNPFAAAGGSVPGDLNTFNRKDLQRAKSEPLLRGFA